MFDKPTTNSNNLYLFYCSLLRKYGKIDVNI